MIRQVCIHKLWWMKQFSLGIWGNTVWSFLIISNWIFQLHPASVAKFYTHVVSSQVDSRPFIAPIPCQPIPTLNSRQHKLLQWHRHFGHMTLLLMSNIRPLRGTMVQFLLPWRHANTPYVLTANLAKKIANHGTLVSRRKQFHLTKWMRPELSFLWINLKSLIQG